MVVCGGVCVCVRTSVHAWVRDVFAIYDDNILSRLIMIIIKIIILYFIQIRHTDDFPESGYTASNISSVLSALSSVELQHSGVARKIRPPGLTRGWTKLLLLTLLN